MAALARRQHGRVAWHQLVTLGIATSTIGNWVKSGYLLRVLPKVYAVGHAAPSHEADLMAAVIYAGPGAMLSHQSAAHYRGLIKFPPGVIHVSTPRSKIPTLPGKIIVHRERACRRAENDGIPTTAIPQTLLDLASTNEPKLLRRALATLDFRKELDVPAIERVCGKGRRGSTALKEALEAHQPGLAYANGELEERFLAWCVAARLPLPKLNVEVEGELVDAYWPGHNLVVELDGYANHSSPAQLRRDRQRELKLRRAGIQVIRYDWDFVLSEREAVEDDLAKRLL